MRLSIILLAGMLAGAGLAGIAAAQEPSGDPPNPGPPNEPSQSSHPSRPPPPPQRPDRPEPCGSRVRNCDLEHISFTVADDGRSLTDYTVDGVRLFDRILLPDNLTAHREANRILFRNASADAFLALFDQANGQVMSNNMTLNFTFPAGSKVERDGVNARILLPSGIKVNLNAAAAEWQDLTVQVGGHTVVNIHPPAASSDKAEHAELREQKSLAFQRRYLGADITLRKAPGLAPESEVVPYDDVQVKVELPADQASGHAPIRIVVSADLDEGRTIVLDIDPALFSSAAIDDLRLGYYDVHDDGSQTEVVFNSAASLQDVFDPTNDGAQPEYWIVTDANGIHVIASIPYWSTHAITISSVGEALAQPNVIIGITVGAAAIVVASAILLRPKKPRY